MTVVSSATDTGARDRAMAAPPGDKLLWASITKLARCYVVVAVGFYFFDLFGQTRDGLTDGAGRPFGDDFINFWSAPFLAWHHRAAEIYNFAAFHAFEQSVVGGQIQFYHYSYPPTLVLLMAPFALVPYVPGLALWLLGGWYAFYRALRLAVPNGRALLLALATPAVFINAIGGQNGTWTAALFGGGLGLLDRRPIMAGGLLGLLIYKPHFGILIPVALVAGRRWRALAAAAASAGGVIAIAAMCFGPDIFTAYLRHLMVLRQLILENGTGVWHRMVSIFVTARHFGADVPTAYAVQGAFAVVAATAVAVAWFKDASSGVRNALVVLGTCLASPYVQDYDLVFGALVVAWLWHDPDVRRLPELTLLSASAALLLIPAFAGSLALATGFDFGPLATLPLFVIAAKSALLQPRVPAAAHRALKA